MSEDFGWSGHKDVNDLVRRFENMLEAGMQYFFDVDEFEAIIDYYFDSNNYRMSRLAIEQALLQHPSNHSFNISEARVLANEKKFYEALELLNHLELLEPTNDEVFITKGEIYSVINKHELAIDEYKKSLPYTEHPEDIYANIAFEYENLNNYVQTIHYLKKALEVKPESESLIHEIAFFFEITGREEEAITFFNEFIDMNPYSKVAWFNLGVFYNSLELFEKAIEAYDFTLAIDERFSSAYFNIANSYSGLKMYNMAIKYYRETFKYESPEAITYFYIGECYEDMGDVKNALQQYNKALEIDDKLGDAWAAVGNLFVNQKRDKVAVKYYEKAVELMPLNDEFKFDLAMIYLRNDLTKKSDRLFREVLDHDPQHIESWLQLSYCKYLIKGVDKAIEVIERGLDKNKNEASLWYRLAGYLYQSGKIQQAYHYIETALKLDFEKHAELVKFLPQLNKESRFIELLGIYTKKG